MSRIAAKWMTWHLRISYIGVSVSCCLIHKFWAFCMLIYKAVFLLSHIKSMSSCSVIDVNQFLFKLGYLTFLQPYGFKGHICFMDCSRLGQTVYLDTYFRRKKNMLFIQVGVSRLNIRVSVPQSYRSEFPDAAVQHSQRGAMLWTVQLPFQFCFQDHILPPGAV